MKLKVKAKLSDQRGFASLIIAMILIIVLGLLTIGFAELMRHSQTQELNRHLSDQAYYAAESGINDAARALNNGYDRVKTNCGPITTDPDPGSGNGAWKYLSSDSVGGSGSSANWTCLLINPRPDSLVYSSISTDTPKTFIFRPVNSDGNPLPLNRLEIYWQGGDKNDTNFRAGAYNGQFPVAKDWGSVGMLRFTITPLKKSNQKMDRQYLLDSTYTAYFYPGTSTANDADNYKNGDWSQQGDVLNGGCNNTDTSQPRYCHVTINNIPFYDGSYLVSLRSIYSPTSVYIQGFAGALKVNFDGAQSLVDSTGKAENVLRRLQVRLPDRANYPYSGFDVEATGSICKQLSGYPSINGEPQYMNLNC